ncbi:MAG: 4Fe-4S binding protein, partial [Planctomycetes bacterium]|nr:4Fe-4S binding protein [Planctomycetota bacterium]
MAAKIDAEKCTGCESCIPECPAEAISLINGK